MHIIYRIAVYLCACACLHNAKGLLNLSGNYRSAKKFLNALLQDADVQLIQPKSVL